ncbi:argininosuccinate synthase [Buchnera aphidicola]|uniref:argininosuccinate synthase n=1 Tax=Buchnera aphidicola TaxID=9 RepID=UPI0031B855B0
MNKIYKKNTIVLAYSGGLDTSAIIPWLQETYNFNIVAFVADIGQSRKDLYDIEKKAINSGAYACHIEDLRNTFVENFVFPMLSIGAMYEGKYLLGTAISRPLIAQAQIQFAKKIHSIGVCHGATGKGNDQVRFEMAYATLAPDLKILAPWREWKFRSREDLLNYLKEKKIFTTVNSKKIYSKDENVFHISTEGGVLENTWNSSNKHCWSWTQSPQKAPDVPERIVLHLYKGRVVKINDETFSPYKCLKKLNKIGAKHAVGRIDIVENRLIGLKSRGCYETPGGTIIFYALRALEELILDHDSYTWKHIVALKMSTVIYNGQWFTPLRDALQNSSKVFSDLITGKVLIELYKGTINVLKKQSPNTLYISEYSTFGKDSVYNQKDAHGFIQLFSLSSRLRALNHNFKK